MLRINRNALNIQVNQNQPTKGSKTPSPPQLKPFKVNDDIETKRPLLALKQQTNALVTNKAIPLAAITTTNSTMSAAQNHVALSRIPILAKSLEKEEEIEDIDKTTGREALFLLSDIAQDVYDYLFDLEQEHPIPEDYLKDQRTLTYKVRHRLMNWVLECHFKLKLLSDTLYMSIAIMDQYFNKVTILQQSQVQLVALGAILIASKYEEIYPPDINDLIVLGSNQYSKRDIIRVEIEILERLGFDLSRPIPLVFLRRFSKAAHCDIKMNGISRFLMEMSLVEYECCHWKPSLLAAAALYTTLHLVHHQHENQVTTTNSITGFGLSKRLNTPASLISSSTPQWNRTLMHYTRYRKEQLVGPAATLCKLLKRVIRSPQAYSCAKRNSNNISKWPELKSARVDELIKQGDF